MAREKLPSAEPAAADAYTVLARRYRPQQLRELVGQDAVSRALENALKTGRVAHAYLFTGARGVGKTSTARILAKCLNCERGPTVEPCDVCSACKSIASGEDVDVLEIDGASNNGVEKVREIRANVQYRPSRSRFKIYIVDEVHMLTTAAFNALLKTLEEPPPHVKFIFATTEAQKIPITILSRCQRFDFPGIGLPQIVNRLREIVKAEGMTAEDEALEMVARRAGGSMRDAQSLLDQLLAFGGERLTADQVHLLLGTAGDDRVLALASAILNRDIPAALAQVGEMCAAGLQLGELVDQLMNYWRDLMVLHCSGDLARDLSIAPRHRPTLQAQASNLKLDAILAGLDILNATRMRMKLSPHGRLLLELAVVRLARLEDLVPIAQVAQWLSQGGAPPVGTAGTVTAPPEGIKKNALNPVRDNGTVPPAPVTALTEQTLASVWEKVCSQLGPMHATQLEKCGLPAIFAPNTLVLSFPRRYNQEYEFCQAPDRARRVEEALEKITGAAWKLRVELSSTGQDSATLRPAVEPAREAATARTRRLRQEVESEPLIKRAMEVLGAQVVRVEDGFGVPLPARPALPANGSETDEEEP